MPEQIEPHSYAVKLQANQQVFRCGDVLGIRGRVPLPGYGLNKRGCDGRGKLPSGQEKT
jgi:hypothetical protein